MLHEIRNIRIDEKDPTGFQFDYRGREIQFFTENINER